jgi:hypothetical protein
MTIQELINEANARSIKLYLTRQQLASNAQQINLQSQQVDMELLKIDGEIEVLQKLLADEQNNAK